MKVKLIFFLCAFILILTGCNYEEMVTEDLPENLLIEIEQTGAPVTSAPILTVEFIQVDEDKAIEIFLNKKVTSEESNAYGRTFFTDQTYEQSEYLYVYGDKDTAITGGLRYTIYEETSTDYYDVVSVDPGPPDHVIQASQTFNGNYSTFTDLSFKTYQEVEDQMIDKLELIGIKEVEVDEIYALDQETMNDYLMKKEAYNREYHEVKELKNVDLREDDEAYLLQFRQIFNDIPIVNFAWQSNPINSNDSTQTLIRAIYNKEGIYELDVKEYYTVISEEDTEQLISQAEALAKVVNKYRNSIISSTVLIDQAELNYIGITEGSERQLIPAWIFRTVSEIDEPEENITYQDYQFIVIDAITGEEIML